MRANRIHLRCACANAAVEAAALPRFEDLRALRLRRKRTGKESVGESVAFLVDENRNPLLCGKETRDTLFFWILNMQPPKGPRPKCGHPGGQKKLVDKESCHVLLGGDGCFRKQDIFTTKSLRKLGSTGASRSI